ncbi:MAG: UDP-galactopyranose mutase [Lachnospiraceae bacterium]|nr:UDP-galactopyranose mutase [Lachnospiraceae bacterium]
MRYDALIVGAGLYGATCAHLLAARGAHVLVIDRRPHIAGNSYTEIKNGIHIHRYGAHIFHTANEEVWDFVRRFASFNRFTNSPVADYHGEIYPLPFNMGTFNRLWGVRTPEEAREKIAAQVAEAGIIGEPKNLEEQALSMAGRDIYEKLIRDYTEKQWGRPCSELPAFILKRVPFRFVYDNNYFNDPHQGIPVDGYTALVERMLTDEALSGSIGVMLSTDYAGFVSRGEDGLPVRDERGDFVLSGGDTAASLIYTGMIDEFFGARLGALEYRSLRFETTEHPETDNLQGCAVVNYTSSEVPWTRCIEHKHFMFGRKDGGAGGTADEPEQRISGTVVTREYPLAWKPGEEPYYPINDEANNARYGSYRALAEGLPGILFGGRLGRYQYYNMDQVIAVAIKDMQTFSSN